MVFNMTTTVDTEFGTFTEENLKTLKGAVDEIELSLHKMATEKEQTLHKMATEKEQIKDVLTFIHGELKIPKNIVKKMAMVQFKQSYQKVISENDEF